MEGEVEEVSGGGKRRERQESGLEGIEGKHLELEGISPNVTSDPRTLHPTGSLYRVGLVFCTIDLLCSPRFIVLPVVLLEMFGGPSLVFVMPASLWAAITFTVTLIFVSSIERADGMECERVLDSDRGWWRCASRWHLSFSRRACSITSIICSVFDFLISLFGLAISIIIVLIIIREPDGSICVSWEREYTLLILSSCFFCLSILARICWVAAESVFLSKTNRCCKMFCSQYVDDPSFIKLSTWLETEVASPGWAMVRCVSQGLCAMVILVALGFTVAITHTTLDSYVYSQPSFENCDPMISTMCALPFPSAYWLDTSLESDSGYRVNVGERVLPWTTRRLHQGAAALNDHDGFSVSGPILWALDGFSDASQLVAASSITDSLSPTSTSLLLNLDTQTFAPHFSERDDLYEGPSEDRILYSVPAEALQFSSRYVMVVQRLQSSDGSLIPAVPLTKTYVQAYLYGGSVDPDDLRYQRFIAPTTGAFAVLQSLGVDLEDLQIIWDFHTASETSITGQLRDLEEKTRLRVEQALSDGQQSMFTHIKTEKGGDCLSAADTTHEIALTVFYKITVPWFLENDKRQNNRVRRDILDLGVTAEDVSRIPLQQTEGLAVVVPCSIVNNVKNVNNIIEFGHGVFGDRSFVYGDFARLTTYTAPSTVFWGMDWRGFSRFDIPTATRAVMFGLEDGTLDLQSATLQCFMSKLTATLILPTLLEKEKERLQIPSSALTQINEAELSFAGLSMGGILGASYLVTANYSRSVLLVPGSPFTYLMGKSDLFLVYVLLMNLQFFDIRASRVALTTMQVVMDAFESTGWANTGVYERNKSIYIQAALGDSTVNPITTQILARNVRALNIEPSTKDVSLLATTPPIVFDVNESYLVFAEYQADYEKVSSSYTSTPDNTDVHFCFPRLWYFHISAMEFLEDGDLISPCAPCALMSNGNVAPSGSDPASSAYCDS